MKPFKTDRLTRSNPRRRLAAATRSVVETLEKRRLLAVIVPGERVSGEIAEVGEQDEYTFNASVGDEIIVNIRETDGNSDGVFPLDPAITLFAPDGSQVDAGSGSFVASAFEDALQSGEYRIVVADNFNNDVGSYDLSLLTVPGPAGGYATDRDAEGDDRVIQSGERVSGVIDAAAVDVDRYTFTAEAGDEIFVNILETDGNLDGAFPLDPRITVYNPDGSRLDDASGSFVASAFGNALQTGEYLIVVRDNFNNDVGSYDLSLLTVPGPASGYASDSDVEGDDRVIESGQRLSGAIDAAAVDLDRFTFTAEVRG